MILSIATQEVCIGLQKNQKANCALIRRGIWWGNNFLGWNVYGIQKALKESV